MKRTVPVSILLGAAIVIAQPPNQNPSVRHVIGLESIKRNASGHLTIQNGTMQFNAGKTEAKVPASSIDDVFVGTETTQSGGPAGRVVKTAAIAAPFGSGKALTLLMRTKVDILTVVFGEREATCMGQFLPFRKDRLNKCGRNWWLPVRIAALSRRS